MKGLGAILLACACHAAGCLPPAPGQGIDALHPPDRPYQLQAVQPLLSRQPVNPDPIDPVRAFRAAPARALAPGTEVVRAPVDDPRAVNTQSAKIDPRYHPWVFVEVTAAPIEAHEGWSGWIHIDALSTDKAPAPALTPELLHRASFLCAFPDNSAEPSPGCPLEVHPSLPLQLLQCAERDYALVQLWDPDGNYVSGYLRSAHFTTDPCP